MGYVGDINDGLDEHDIILDIASIRKDREGAELGVAGGHIHVTLGLLEAA